MEKNEGFLKQYADVIIPANAPPARFGHTVNLVSKTTVVVFGGAISSPGNYTMTADLYLYNMALNSWKKLERKKKLHKKKSISKFGNDSPRKSCSCFCNSERKPITSLWRVYRK